MAKPNYPIFMFDGLDLIVISSLERLQAELEPIDAKSGIFETYDSEGRRVRLTTTRRTIAAETDPTESIADREFEAKLRAFLKAVGSAVADDLDCSLRCLMEAARKAV
jgi:hypothetical protein